MYTVSTLAPPKPDIGVSAPTTQLGMDCIVEISCNASTETPIWVNGILGIAVTLAVD